MSAWWTAVLLGWLLAGCQVAPGQLSSSAWLWDPGWSQRAIAPWPFSLELQAGVDEVALAGGWQVERALDGAGAATEVCRGPAGDTAFVVIGEPVPDFDAEVQIQIAPGGEESAGLAFRWRNAEAFYLARVNTRNNNVRLYRRDAGHWVLLATRDLPVPVGLWHRLQVRARGSTLAVGLDGERLLEATDQDLTTGGLVLWLAPRTEGCFADFRLVLPGRERDRLLGPRAPGRDDG
ncbi:MAG TPA: family 16 glycoside hydrolase [Chloroflexota bacterium]|nr:family 16 glycoside hydrolase [Chloroflexota bacterium]